ncbi:PH, RCC1 and FYVE domains-containing protein 1 [Linum perenne]
MDSFVPRPLESAFIWDVHAIACGRQHAAFVTKQGAVFTWGEELGGRLGHGMDANVLHPKHLDGLKDINVELVACGEYHSCAVSLSGDLYIWGNSASSLKFDGYGTESSQWDPCLLSIMWTLAHCCCNFSWSIVHFWRWNFWSGVA